MPVSKIILTIIFLLMGLGLVYFTFIDSGVRIDDYQDNAQINQSNSDEVALPTKTVVTFYETGDNAICTVGSGSVESIYYFHEGKVRVSGAINGQEVNSIYKNNQVYSWAVLDGEIVSPINYRGENARENNLTSFGPADYETVCQPWLEVDRSIFVLPLAEFEVVNN